jgi:thiol-disulfide isomerase/thioredoxin
VKPLQIIALAVGGALLGAIVGIAWQQYEERQEGAPFRDGQSLEEFLPAFSFADLDGNRRTRQEWNGKILVLNFWASWCPPCRDEMPLFVALQEEFAAAGVQFVGIAIDDQEPVQAFVDAYGIDFPTLLGDMAAIELAKRLGNRFGGLPFTVIARADGKILLRHPGELKREQLLPLLQELVADRAQS